MAVVVWVWSDWASVCIDVDSSVSYILLLGVRETIVVNSDTNYAIVV